MIPTYLAFAASPKHLHDDFAYGVETFRAKTGQSPATVLLHPATAALLAGTTGVEIVEDARIPPLYLYVGPKPEDMK
jgi:glyoxylase-like metal-dependent hydrolase (beta-lactamase superfamily II)